MNHVQAGEGETLGLALALGLTDGETDADGETEADGLILGLTLDDGDIDAEAILPHYLLKLPPPRSLSCFVQKIIVGYVHHYPLSYQMSREVAIFPQPFLLQPFHLFFRGHPQPFLTPTD